MSKGRREDQPPGSLSQGANAEQEPWIKPTDNYYRQRLDEITGGGKFERLTNQLRLVTHPRLKHPLRILALDGNMPVEDIPLAATSYQHATFRAATEPQSRDGNVYTRAVRLGYDINFEFRRILPINYIRLNDTRDQVEEVGLGSELAVEYFQHHVFGRDLSEQTRERMRHVQETIFDALRNNPQAQAELASFVTSRKWPYGLAEKARLAYYDPRLTFTIKEEGQEKEVGFMHWAKAQGFTNEEMYLTGWYDLSFSNSGQPTYTPRDAHVIRIPFFKDGRIEVWRTRNLREKRAASHKYTSWPLDRSINRELTASEKLYNGWRLDEARGKMLVLTEGEFKCLVATETTGTFTVGIPGITEVDETIIQAIAKAGVWGVTVVLDRDPQGKGMMRVDGITDSERAAYAIALQLRAAGVSNVRVGQIPDIRGGEKVGLDDLILDNGPQAMNVLLNRAVTPEQYARDINLNPVFFDIWRARQQANKVVEQYENSARRGGSIVAPAIYEQAVQMRDELQELYEHFLVNRFRGARHIDQPQREFATIFRTNEIVDADRKIVLNAKGEEIPLARFLDDIIYFQYFTSDLPQSVIWTGQTDTRVPFSLPELQTYFETGRGNERLREYISLGIEAIGITPESAFQIRSVRDLGTVAFAGYLSRLFPTDEYKYETNLTFYVNKGTYWEEHSEVPLGIRRKGSGDIVALGSLLTAERQTPINNALMADRRAFNLTQSFLRKYDTFHAETRFKQVYETLWPYWFEKNKADTIARLAELGISAEIVEQHGLLLIKASDYPELMQHFLNRTLLNQATNAGIFRMDETHHITPRFQGDVVIIPVLDERKQVVTFRALPLTLNDHFPPSLDPDLKLVRQLDGGAKHLQAGLNPERLLYMQENLAGVKGKTLVVTYNELDGLILRAGEQNVVSLNSSFRIDEDLARKIAEAQPERICFVISGSLPKSAYDAFSTDGVPGYLKDLFDAAAFINQHRALGTSPIPIEITALSTPLTHIASGAPLTITQVRDITEGAVDLHEYLKLRRFNVQQHANIRNFLTAADVLANYLEVSAYSEVLFGRALTGWINDTLKYYNAIKAFATQQQIAIPTLDSYFQERLHLADAIPLQELIRLRREEERVFIHRPIYVLHGRASSEQMQIPEEFRREFEQTLEGTSNGTTPVVNLLAAAGPVRRRRNQTMASQQVVVSPVVEEEIMGNPKGEVLQRLQREQREDFIAPVPQITEIPEGFRYTLTVVYNDKPYSGVGQGKNKVIAERMLYAEIRRQIEIDEQQDLKPQEAVVIVNTPVEGNPTAYVNEALVHELPRGQRAGFKPPTPEIIPITGGFRAVLQVTLGGKIYIGNAVGTNMQAAKSAMYDQIRTQREADIEQERAQKQTIGDMPQENALGISQRAVSIVQALLRQSSTNKDYVGLLQRIFQGVSSGGESGWEVPQYDPPVKEETREGTRWTLTGRIRINGRVLENTQRGASLKEIKHQIALDILTQLSELISEQKQE